MNLIRFLSSRDYEDTTFNHGDCVLLDTGQQLVIYDCGSEDHAERIENYMAEKKYSTATAILSHHDTDHYNGLTQLADRGLLSAIYTHYLVDYKDDLLAIIDDGRKTPDSVKKQIEDAFTALDDFPDSVEVRDAFNLGKVTSEIELLGPTKDEALEYVAQYLDGREPDLIESQTIFNVLSIRVKVTGLRNNESLLLTGDCHFGAIEDVVRNFDVIQLPHHGNSDTADLIFGKMVGRLSPPTYVVSDNTGDSNGGSDKLNSYGKRLYNTKTAGDIEFSNNSIGIAPVKSSGCLG